MNVGTLLVEAVVVKFIWSFQLHSHLQWVKVAQSHVTKLGKMKG